MPSPIEHASRIMLAFAERSGLTSDRPQRRYLWTDAFAVCNLLGLSAATSEQRYHALALALIDRVHHVLGRHRPDDPRTGWLSGLDGAEAEAHPTRGGLRIGKPLPERAATQPYDPQLEWERDGQYFHYLTKWMHALDRMALTSRQPRFNVWARELARTAHAAFVYRAPPQSSPCMFWKASIDLSRPLVTSMGQHDPLDGFVTCAQLRSTAQLLCAPSEPNLSHALADFGAMLDAHGLHTDDPLGLGGLLMDAGRVAQLMVRGALPSDALLQTLLAAALAGVERYVRQGALRLPARRRLAFRECGLAIGLHAVESIQEQRERLPQGLGGRAALTDTLDALAAYVPLAAEIESFWLEPAQRAAATSSEHRDIDEVMLASSLTPEGCLTIVPSSG